ncbi:25804_t:CDS:2 [Dentiscutata erythropus]|uniref:25804_t:CDS:1 n=1 Tax=Dentiscutata erythropus TaxID=1348616 RepID=A0A9N9DH13_9GLOM|nr:25804_t:CDS:2 [Dentiscutata erythropus]
MQKKPEKKKDKETISKSEPQKKRKNQTLNKNNSGSNLVCTSTELSVTIPTAQEQQSYVEWEDKKLQMQQKNLELLKDEVALREN